MKRIQDFKIGEEVRIREDLIAGKKYSGIYCNFLMEAYKDKIFSIKRVISGEEEEASYLELTEISVWNFSPEFFVEDPVIGVKFPGNNKEYSYKCQFPIELGDILIVTVSGTEKEVTVTSLHGDESKATKYVTRKKTEECIIKPEFTSFSKEQIKSRIARGGTEGIECILPLRVIPDRKSYKFDGTEVSIDIEFPPGLVESETTKSFSIELPQEENFLLETAKISHPVEIEVEQEEEVPSKDYSLSLRGITFNGSIQEAQRKELQEWLNRQSKKLNGVF